MPSGNGLGLGLCDKNRVSLLFQHQLVLVASRSTVLMQPCLRLLGYVAPISCHSKHVRRAVSMWRLSTSAPLSITGGGGS